MNETGNDNMTPKPFYEAPVSEIVPMASEGSGTITASANPGSSQTGGTDGDDRH